jgi:hypothetical protein
MTRANAEALSICLLKYSWGSVVVAREFFERVDACNALALQRRNRVLLVLTELRDLLAEFFLHVDHGRVL